MEHCMDPGELSSHSQPTSSTLLTLSPLNSLPSRMPRSTGNKNKMQATRTSTNNKSPTRMHRGNKLVHSASSVGADDVSMAGSREHTPVKSTPTKRRASLERPTPTSARNLVEAFTHNSTTHHTDWRQTQSEQSTNEHIHEHVHSLTSVCVRGSCAAKKAKIQTPASGPIVLSSTDDDEEDADHPPAAASSESSSSSEGEDDTPAQPSEGTTANPQPDSDDDIAPARRTRLNRRKQEIVDESEDDEQPEAAPVDGPPIEEQSSDDEKEDSDQDDEDMDEDTEEAAHRARPGAQFMDDAAEEGSEEEGSEEEEEAAPAAATSSSSPSRSHFERRPVASSPTKVRAWGTAAVAPGSGGFVSSGGSNAKHYSVLVLVRGDPSFCLNKGSMTARRFLVGINMETKENMVIAAYGDDANKYLANAEPRKPYGFQLNMRPINNDKQQCLVGVHHSHTFASGSTIKPYIKTGAADLSLQFTDVDAVKHLCSPVSAIRELAAGALVNLAGIIVEVHAKDTRRDSNGVKVTLADEHSMVQAMLFQGKNVMIGDTLTIIGGRVWVDNKTGSKQVSVWGTAVVSTNSFEPSKNMRKVCKSRRFEKLVNISSVPCGEVRAAYDIQMEAQALPTPTGTITGTVQLRIDAEKMVQTGGNVYYNACIKCRKKMKPKSTEEPNIYVHDIDGDHEATTFECHYFFKGRFKEPNDDVTVWVAQVDDELALRIFGCTADELHDLSTEMKDEVFKKATESVFKYNMTMTQEGIITSLIMV